MLLIAGYVHFFTGKKKPKGPVPPVQTQAQPAKTQQGQPQAQAQQGHQQAAQPAQPTPPGQQGQPPQVPGKPEAAAQRGKPQFDKLRVGWESDPFMLPVIKRKKGREDGSAVRLVAILEGGTGRVAVIDRDVVKRGDMIGNEKVAEIGKDRVVLVRSGMRRTLILADADAVATEEALTTKPKAAERAK